MQDAKQDLLHCLKNCDLLRASLIAGQVKESDFEDEKYVATILRLVDRIWKVASDHRDDAVYMVEAINTVLFQEYKLNADSKSFRRLVDDPGQYYVHHLLEKKKGSPLSFMILYWIIAEQVGIECHCVSFPAHFFLKVNDVAGEFYIDPFNGGKILAPTEFQRKFKSAISKNQLLGASIYEILTKRQVISRLIRRLKHVYILKNDPIHALRAVELLTALHPGSPELTRDRGILYCEMEYFSKAVSDLTFYIHSRPEADDIKEIRKLHRMLRGYSVTVN